MAKEVYIKPSITELIRRLAKFADVADNRNFADDESIIADWLTMKGSKEVRAVLRVGDCRAAREFVKKVDSAKARKEAEAAFVTRQPSFGD